VDAIISEGNHTQRTKRSTIEQVRRKLFFTPKQEDLSPHIDNEIFNKIFVKTAFYRAVEERDAYLFIGRKGSGKSFPTEYFTRNPIEANTIPIAFHLRRYRLATIYEMKTSSKISADLESGVISQKDIFEAVWNLIFFAATALHWAFTGAPVSLDYSELYERLQRVDFRLSSGDSLDEFWSRVDFLYEIGFLGIVLDPQTQKRLKPPRHESFAFSCPLDIHKDITIDNKEAANWIIHPIFSEYLQLKTDSAPFLLMYSTENLIAEE